MTPAAGLALVLAAAVLLAWIRLLLRQRHAPGPRWRLVLLGLLQPACAGLLYLTLLPPTLPTQAGTMTVLTAGATRDLVASRATGETLVSLPEAPRLAGAEPVPDLATALRLHPGVARLQVLGHGLDPRDRDAAGGPALDFEPAPLPRGLVRLDGPERTAPGTAFSVTGRFNGLDGGEVRLLDPAGGLVDAADVGEEGGFHLRGYARAPGLATFALQVFDVDGEAVESAEVPLHVAADPAPRVLLLSGAPNPEFRHLRRWADDAGLDLHVEVAVGGGVGLGDGPAPASAEGFGEFDLVILDERALGSLGAGRRAALAQALGAGTGVLVRATTELPASVRRHMADLGLAVTGNAGTQTVALPQVDDPALLRARLGPGSEDVPFDPALAQEAPPELLRRTLQPQGGDAVPLPAGGAEAAFAWWRAQGRGRIGLWTLSDSYRLALAGRDDLHAGLWSAAVTVLARPAADASPRFDADAHAGRRLAICGLTEVEGRVIAPDGTEASVLVDPAVGGGGLQSGDADGGSGPAAGSGPGQALRRDACAGYWPTAGGWHLLRVGDEAWPFHVRAADDVPGIVAAGLREETLRLAGPGLSGPGETTTATASSPRRGPSWPWFLAWLAAAGIMWWLERRRPKPS